jgi:predicted P-loop ATPase/GTPase
MTEIKTKILNVLFDGKSFKRYDAIRITQACNSKLSVVVPALLELESEGKIFSFETKHNVAPGRWDAVTLFMHSKASGEKAC